MTGARERGRYAEAMSDSDDRGMRWGVKESFVDYIARAPGGQVSVTEGAGFVAESRQFAFPLLDATRFDVAANAGVLEFAGDVRFSGHFGFLYLPLTRPRIEVAAGVARLSFVVPDGREGDDEPVVLAELDWPLPDREDALAWHSTRVRLAPAGAPLFNGSYGVGEPLDAVTIALSAHADSAPVY